MNDPFYVQGPAVISFSGGRTSGYMLWRVIQAHGGKLPTDVVPMFANTGKEREETLAFVSECGERWGVPIAWIEYAGDGTDRIATFETAARNGEPFETIIRERGYLPNPTARFCTIDLKVIPMERAAKALGFEDFLMVVGLRADEPRRVAKVRASPSGGRKGYERVVPLADAGITVEDVNAFWMAQPFTLNLPTIGGKTVHGNCDLCFLKGVNTVRSLVRESPARAVWWIKQEASIVNVGQIKGDPTKFRADRESYAAMHFAAVSHDEMVPFEADEGQACGVCTE